ncbi:MAG TPA: ABC transporter permease [Bacillota bacterium]
MMAEGPVTPRHPWPRFSRRALAVLLRHWWSWRKTYRSSVLLNFGEPLLNLVALGWGLGAYVTRINDLSFLEFVAPGLMAVTAMNAVVFDTAFGGHLRLHREGIYDAAMNTSLSENELVAGDLLWEAARSLLYGTIFLLVLLAFGLVRSAWVLVVPAVLILMGLLFAALTLTVVTKARELEYLFYFFSLVITPMFLFSGVFFPVERLPEALAWVVRLLPLYHAVEILRDLVLGQVGRATWVHFVWLAVMTLAVMRLPVPHLRKVLQK